MDAARLDAIPLLAEVPDEERRNIATFAEEHSVADGDQVVTHGDFADRISIIEEGTAEVRREGRLLDSLGPGDVFGEIGVLERRLRNADVVATSPLRLITLTQWDMRRVPQTAERMRKLADGYVPVDG